MNEYKVTVTGKHGSEVSLNITASSPAQAVQEGLQALRDLDLMLPDGVAETKAERV